MKTDIVDAKIPLVFIFILLNNNAHAVVLRLEEYPQEVFMPS